eukprot:Gb_23305 [translate_table: standard]
MASPASSISISISRGGLSFRNMGIGSPIPLASFSNNTPSPLSRRVSNGRYHSISQDENDELSSEFVNYTVQIPPTPNHKPMFVSSSIPMYSNPKIARKAKQQFTSNIIFTGGYNSVTTGHVIEKKMIEGEANHPQMACSRGLICAMEGCDGKWGTMPWMKEQHKIVNADGHTSSKVEHLPLSLPPPPMAASKLEQFLSMVKSTKAPLKKSNQAFEFDHTRPRVLMDMEMQSSLRKDMLEKLPNIFPVNRVINLNVLKDNFEHPSLQNPRGRFDLPRNDVFVSTADPEKEPPLVTANTILSSLITEYSMENLSCYLSDDGGDLLTFEALIEAARFSRICFPFCRKHSIKPHNLENYSNIKNDFTKNKVREDFVKERRRVKGEYDEFKENIVDSTDEDIRLPMLVYVSREKRPSYDHNRMAGAMNTLVHTSAIMSNGPFVLNMDCNHYVYNSLALREVMCFMMDRALNGLQGPMYVGIGCLFKRIALYGFDPPMTTEHGGCCGWKKSTKDMDASSLNGKI